MKRLKIGDLERVREKVRKISALRQSKARARVTIHMGTCGIAAGAKKILTALLADIEKAKLEDIIITTSGCAGLCSREPMATLVITGNPPVKYGDLTPEKIKDLIHEHIINGNIIEKYALAMGCERTY